MALRPSGSPSPRAVPPITQEGRGGPAVGGRSEGRRSHIVVDVPAKGWLNSEVARAVVRVHRSHTGRGPTQAKAFFRRNVVVVVLQSVLTRAEQSLARGGRLETVLDGRRELQEEMRAHLVDAVEGLTGCRVTAFMSDNHVEPDMAVELFVLDRSVPGPGPDHPTP